MSGIRSPFMMPEQPPRKKVVQNIQIKRKDTKLPKVVEYSAIGGLVALTLIGIILIREGGLLEVVGICAVVSFSIVGAHAIIDKHVKAQEKEDVEEQMKEVADMIGKQINGQF